MSGQSIWTKTFLIFQYKDIVNEWESIFLYLDNVHLHYLFTFMFFFISVYGQWVYVWFWVPGFSRERCDHTADWEDVSVSDSGRQELHWGTVYGTRCKSLILRTRAPNIGTILKLAKLIIINDTYFSFGQKLSSPFKNSFQRFINGCFLIKNSEWFLMVRKWFQMAVIHK